MRERQQEKILSPLRGVWPSPAGERVRVRFGLREGQLTVNVRYGAVHIVDALPQRIEAHHIHVVHLYSYRNLLGFWLLHRGC
jgi:hypothetical protein